MKESLEMHRKDFIYLLLLLTTLFIMPGTALSETPPDPVSITVKTTPEPYLSQLTSGDRCVFNVEIRNLAINIQQGQIVNASDPTVKYSGNFTVESTFEIRKQGIYYYGGQSVSYITGLNNTQIDNYYSITIPPIGETLTYTFTYNLTKGYEVFGVRPDENMVLYFRVNVFVQTYSDKDGIQQFQVGDRVKTLRNDYYIIDFVKREYLQGKLQDIRADVDQLNNINSPQVKIGKAFYQNALNNLNSSLTKGDLVTALQQVQNYYLFDQPTLIALLFRNLNSTATTADAYTPLLANYTALNGKYEVLHSDFETILNANNIQTAAIAELEIQLQRTRDNLLILVGIAAVVMFGFGFLIGYKPRFKRT
jgi:hypothetical protein